ncbi:hypothetical protein [Desulfobacterium sp. N47]|uniref:Uncharacterized protein n=1 Tax=uncultured Desulfobacterium sp. TaxID=201089 RepID=E1YJC2_9BACT|nr:unknown protein [uncultured Desulfobacterium sp.]
MKKARLFAGGLTLLLCLMSYQSPVFGASYFGYQDFGGTWHDANKTGKNDNFMCWAATASNVIAGAGWGYPDGSLEDENAIFQYYKGHFSNFLGSTKKAIKW